MPKLDRRTALRIGAASMTIPVAAMSSTGCTPSPQGSLGNAVKIYFLEIVTPDVDGACSLCVANSSFIA